MAILVVIDDPPKPLPDAELDRRDVYKRGDVVAVVDDAHVFTPHELNLPRFAFVPRPGETAEELYHLIGDAPETVVHATRRSARVTGTTRRVLNLPIEPGARFERRRYFYDFARGEIIDKMGPDR